MIICSSLDFKDFWQAIDNLLTTHGKYNPYRNLNIHDKDFSKALENIDRELINIIKLAERGDQLLPDDCEG